MARLRLAIYSFLSVVLAPMSLVAGAEPSSVKPVPFKLKLDIVSEGYDGKTCWFHPRAGANPGDTPTIVLTMQKWDIKASDLFLPVQSQESKDFGKTWSPIVEHADTLGRRPEPDDVVVGICDFTPKWHAASKTLIGTGQTVRYKNDKLIAVRPRESVWSIYDPKQRTWSKWVILAMPNDPKWWNSGAGSTQRVDLDNGDILLPIYFKPRDAKAYSTTIARCQFDGKELKFVENGSELSVNIDRGLYEPSLTRFRNKYYLTMCNDRAGYISVSDDGLKFNEPKKWTFDDGSDLGNYNTQQHWVTHSDGLFLCYTRRGAMNDHVVRHRAPLFIAQVDPAKMVVLKSTERELVPNKGAQLGNFAVVDVNEKETWVTTSEGMSPRGSEKYGANGRVYAARLIWEKPNGAWDKH